MKLIDLDPRWLVKDGKRVGFTFKSPIKQEYRQSCFSEQTPMRGQLALFARQHGEDAIVQPCRPDFAWAIAGGIEAATFDAMTVTPSLDGSAGGLWHGHITNGEIVGGL